MIKKSVILFLILSLGACSSQYQKLPMVNEDDPVVRLNPDRWQATVNDLMTPPASGVHPVSGP
jgi:hypothetical protein